MASCRRREPLSGCSFIVSNNYSSGRPCQAMMCGARVSAHEPFIDQPAARPRDPVLHPAPLDGGRAPRPHPLHRDPGQVALLRPRVGGPRPSRPRRRPHRGVEPPPSHRRSHRGDGTAPRTDSGDPHGGAGNVARDHPALRTLRQAAGDDGLGRRPRPVDSGAPRRSSLRPRGPGRRIRRLLRPHRHRSGAAGGRASRAPRRAHRGERGERQPRPSRLHGGLRRPHRRARPRHLPRLRLRQLRAAVGHDVAARRHQRRAHRGSPERRRALGGGERHRAFELPHRAPAALAYRGRAHGRPRARLPRGGARRPCRGSARGGRGARRARRRSASPW